MKVRIKYGLGRPAVGLQTSPETSLDSLKERVVNRLAGETCELSLNGKDALSGNCSLEELGIVSGDTLYVLHSDNSCSVRDGERGAASTTCSTKDPQTHPEMATTSSLPAVASQKLSASSTHISASAARDENQLQNTESGTGTRTCSYEVKRMDRSKRHGAHGAVASKSFGHFNELCLSGSTVACAQDLGQGARNSHVTPSPANTLCIALNRIMLDSGYYAINKVARVDSSSAKWDYGTAVDGRVSVHLACLKMGPLLTVHAMATIPPEGNPAPTVSHTLHLPISRYVSSSSHSQHCQLLRPTALAHTFKDNIAHKLLTDIRKALGLPEVGTFSSLFPELKLLVCRMLDIQSLIALSSVSKELNMLCQDPYLWKYFLLRDFGSIFHNGEVSWKELYIRQFKEMRQRERERVISVFPGDFPLVPLLPPRPPLPSGPPFPGIIGGEYDLRPNLLDPLPPMALNPLARNLRTYSLHPRPRIGNMIM